jgi:hypothetical protein
MNREISQNEGDALISREGVARNRYGGLLGLSRNNEENRRREKEVGIKEHPENRGKKRDPFKK